MTELQLNLQKHRKLRCCSFNKKMTKKTTQSQNLITLEWLMVSV